MSLRSSRSQSRARTDAVRAIAAVLVVTALFGCSPPPESASSAPVVSGTGGAAPPSHAPVAVPDNPTQRRMMTLPEKQQAAILAQAIDHGCTGASPFFMGMGEKGSAMWSVRCTRGHDWVVSINPDEAGTTTVMRCTTFKARTHLECFKKFQGRLQ